MRVLVLLALASSASASFLAGLYNSTIGGINPSTVQNLDLKAFMGRWLQMASDKIVLSTFEKNAFCATATYGLLADGKVSVRNYATIGSVSGAPYSIDGYAYAEDPNELSKLKVHFTSEDVAHSPFDAPYWILQVGPIVNGQYDWAIVSDNLSMTLFVLARNADTYNSQYKASVTALLTSLGFTGFKAPIDLYQGSDCQYEPMALGAAAPAAASSASSAAVAVAGAKKGKTPCKHSVGLGGLFSGLFGSSKTVSALDVPSYMGLWYQEYGNAFVFATTSGESPSCATALYGLKTDGTVSVHNYELDNKGAVLTIDGYAYIPDATKPGQLKVSTPTD